MKAIGWFLAMTGYFVLVLATAAWADPGSDPDHIHFSWQQDPSTTITGVWRTSESITDSVMEVDDGGGPQTFSGVLYSYPNDDGVLHIAEATGLSPKTLYQVRVGDGAGNMSGWHEIKTAPAPQDVCEPFRFVMMGDSRSSISDGASVWWSTLLDAATDDTDPGDPDPDFMIINGDLIKEGGEQDGWNDWFEEGGSDLAKQPVMAAWGNHDDRDAALMMHQFAFPINDVTGNEDFHAYRYGSALFFALDSEHGQTRYQQQGPWMQDQFDANTDAIWKIAYQHRPAYSSGSSHGSEADVQDYFVPYFEDNHLDVDFGSHDHIYERSCYINNDQCVSNPAAGTLYYVTGGAGAMMNPIGGWGWFTETFNGLSYHFILGEVEFNVLTLTMISYLEVVHETIVIEKPELGYPTAAFTANPMPLVQFEQVNFDGADSFDPCGQIVDWTWDFGDGQTDNGEQVAHTYDISGPVTVTLTVTDLDGYPGEISVPYNIVPGGDDDDDDDDDDNDEDNDDASDDDDDDSGGCS